MGPYLLMAVAVLGAIALAAAFALNVFVAG